MTPPKRHKVNTLAEMEQLATDFVNTLKEGQILLLTGEIGVGKTTFTQYLAKSLGVLLPITSPTFTVVAEYPVTNHLVIKQLIHVDLYRLPDQVSVKDPLIMEVLAESAKPNSLVVIEWADKLVGELPTNSRQLSFGIGDNSEQRVVII